MSEERKKHAGGKPPRAVPGKKLTVFVSEPLLAEVKILLFDPVYQKSKYGSMSGLVDSLLAGWVEEQRKAKAAPTPILESGG